MKQLNLVSQFFSHFQQYLQLIPVRQGEASILEPADLRVGLIDFFRYKSIQVMDKSAWDYFSSLSSEQQEVILQQWLLKPPAILIFCKLAVTESFLHKLPASVHVWRSQSPTKKVVAAFDDYLKEQQQQAFHHHGVFLEIFGVGVMLVGTSGIGKSEVALELISRGHRFVSDDSVQLTQNIQGVLEGRSPELLQDFMEVRGMGILNIRKLFGDAAIKYRKNLQLVIQLKSMTTEEMAGLDRLNHQQVCEIEGMEVHAITIPVTLGKSLAVLVETSTRQHIQHLQGYDAADDFMQKQREVIAKNSA